MPDDPQTPHHVEVEAVIEAIDQACVRFNVGAIIVACRRIADGLEEHLVEPTGRVH